MRFATVARVSEINLGLYGRSFSPGCGRSANEPFAEWLRQLHPLRLQYSCSPMPIPSCAPWLRLPSCPRQTGSRSAPDNLLLHAQERSPEQIVRTR